MNKKAFRIFLILSLVMAASDIAFIAINHISSHNTFNTTLSHHAQRIRQNFNQVFHATEDRMLAIATCIAHDSDIQQLFLAGKKAVEKEGGGAGGRQAAIIRKQLYEKLLDIHVSLVNHFDFRQLHFHLGPGSTSFLRVHEPSKFGDNMDNVRHTIVEANRLRKPVTGFETGRIYSGIRGVVPVFAHDKETGKRVFVGSLEAGTSFTTTLRSLAKALDIEVAEVLSIEHMKKNMWPEYVNKILQTSQSTENFFIEKSTSPVFNTLCKEKCYADILEKEKKTQVTKGEATWFIYTFPLRDFYGERHPDTPAAGAIITATNISDAVNDLQRAMATNIIYAIGAFILIEICLYAGINHISRKLGLIIEKSREKLRDALEQETRLKQQIEKERDLFTSGPIALFIWQNREGWPVEYVSANIKEITGYTSGAFVGGEVSYAEIIHPDDIQRVAQEVERNSGKNDLEIFTHQPYRIITPENETVWVLDVTRIMRDQDGKITHYQGYVLDITPHMLLDREIQNARKELELIIDGARVGTWVWDVETGEFHANKHMVELTGYQPDEIDPTFNSFAKLVPHEDVEMMFNYLEDDIKQGNTHFSRTHSLMHKSGKMKYLLATGRIYGVNNENEPLCLKGFTIDISPEKEKNEAAMLRLRQKNQQEHLQSIRNMAGAIAHRLNNIMTAQMISMEMLKKRLAKGSRDEKLAERALRSTHKAAETGRMMLAYLGDDLQGSILCNLETIAKDTVKALAPVIPENTEIIFADPEVDTMTFMSPDQISVVTRNILLNALEAIGNKQGKIKISFGRVTKKASSFPMFFHERCVPETEYIFCRITDNGHGISEGKLDHLFEPFYTTRFIGRGLGLAVAAGIMRSHNGALTLENNIDRGVTATIFLPAHDKKKHEQPHLS
jgi:PAS domain S-box-containing protein